MNLYRTITSQNSQMNNPEELLSNQWDWEVITSQMNKQDKKIENQNNKLNSYLTWDDAIDSVITTPQSQRDPYQIAVANLNPDLKNANKKYHSTLNNLNVLQNERMNLWQASQIMMDAYRNALNNTESAAQNMMWANSMFSDIQSSWAISWMWGLATNPAAAAQTRLSAMNQAAAQNMQIRSNADQNIANIYSNMAQMPSQLASIYQTYAGVDAQNRQLDQQQQQLAQQASQLSRQSSGGWSSYGSGWTYASQRLAENNRQQSTNDFANAVKAVVDKDWVYRFYDRSTGEELSQQQVESILSNYPNPEEQMQSIVAEEK